jgi:hypothetical protein
VGKRRDKEKASEASEGREAGGRGREEGRRGKSYPFNLQEKRWYLFRRLGIFRGDA